MSDAPVSTTGCPGLPLDHLALVVRGACSWPHRTLTTGKTVLGRLAPPGPCTDSRLKHTSSLLGKDSYLLFLELPPQA